MRVKFTLSRYTEALICADILEPTSENNATKETRSALAMMRRELAKLKACSAYEGARESAQ